MRSSSQLVLLLFASFLVSGRKLTTEENEQNSRKCGVHFLGGCNHSKNRLTKKSFGGRQFKQDEYPWTVILTLKDNGLLCSGVQISKRHILTAAHCVLEYDPDYNQLKCMINESYSAVSVMYSPEDILVYIGGNKTDCSNPKICPPYKALYEPVKITVHNYDHCSSYNDLAIIELKENISETHATPICMPDEDLHLDSVLYASGSGADPSIPSTLTDPFGLSRRQQVVAQKLHGVDETMRMIVTVTFAKSVFFGDSGGPLFQVDNSDKHTLVGISSTVDVSQHPKEEQNWQARYTDVREHLDWICKRSGVCPIENTQSSGDSLTNLYGSLKLLQKTVSN